MGRVYSTKHLGSIGLSQGLLVGKKHGRIRTPWPSAFTWALWARIQVRTSLLTCQEALSQMSNQALFPWACTCSHPHCKNCVVMSLTGRPVTKRNDIWGRDELIQQFPGWSLVL